MDTSNIIGSFLAFLTVAQPQAAEAQDGVTRLLPIDDWQMIQLEDQCVAKRTFGDAQAPTTVELHRFDPWNGGFHVTIRSQQLQLQEKAFSAVWQPDGKRLTVDLPIFGKDKLGRQWVSFPHSVIDKRVYQIKGKEAWQRYYDAGGANRFKSEIESFDVDGLFERPISLGTGPMNSISDDLSACMEDMLEARGVNRDDKNRDDHRVWLMNKRALIGEISRRAPSSLRTRSKRSLMSFLLYLDEVGKPTSCKLNPLAGTNDFEDWACDILMRKAQFRFKEGEEASPTFFKVAYWFQPS